MEEKEKNAVCIEDVVEALDWESDDWMSFYNIVTGEIVAVSPEYDDLTKDEREEIYEGEDYIGLPSSFDINGWQIMQNFIYTLPDGEASAVLMNSIHRRGAFRNFKDNAYRFGLIDDYYKFRDNALLDIAKEWCEYHKIPYFHKEKKAGKTEDAE